jgi:ATP-dependent Clp protease ATP-binding subunit ClpC
MFERFTDESRRVVVYAQEESRARADGYIGSAHLLLGLLHIGDATTRVATDAGLTITRGREWLGEHRGRRHPGSVSGHIPFTAEAKRILEEALRVSDESGLWAIDTADRLLGLLAVPDTTARRLLDGLGVDSPRLRARLRALPRTTTILGPAARGTAAGPAEPVVETGRLVAALHVYGRHLDGCRPDDGCTCGLDALLREFPESPTTTWVGT